MQHDTTGSLGLGEVIKKVASDAIASLCPQKYWNDAGICEIPGPRISSSREQYIGFARVYT